MKTTDTKDRSITPAPPPGGKKTRKRYATKEEAREAKRVRDAAADKRRRDRQRQEQEEGVPVLTTEQMLNSMRQVYQKMGGVKNLLHHMKTHPRDYVAMVQNLMKIEASLMEAKAKKSGGEEPQGVFVVMKGLAEGTICPHCGKDASAPVTTTSIPGEEEDEEKSEVKEVFEIEGMNNILDPGAESAIQAGGEW